MAKPTGFPSFSATTARAAASGRTACPSGCPRRLDRVGGVLVGREIDDEAEDDRRIGVTASRIVRGMGKAADFEETSQRRAKRRHGRRYQKGPVPLGAGVLHLRFLLAAALLDLFRLAEIGNGLFGSLRYSSGGSERNRACRNRRPSGCGGPRDRPPAALGAQLAAVLVGLGERRDISGAAAIGIGLFAQALACLFGRFEPRPGCSRGWRALPALHERCGFLARWQHEAGTRLVLGIGLAGVGREGERRPRSSTRCSAAVLSVP